MQIELLLVGPDLHLGVGRAQSTIPRAESPPDRFLAPAKLRAQLPLPPLPESRRRESPAWSHPKPSPGKTTTPCTAPRPTRAPLPQSALPPPWRTHFVLPAG